jgi:hypothetical protein
MSSLADLRFRHRARVTASVDGGSARATFNGMLDPRPKLVTRPLDDVAASVGLRALTAASASAVRRRADAAGTARTGAYDTGCIAPS